MKMLLVLVLGLLPTPAAAQNTIVVLPTSSIQFTASADHDAVFAGSPIVSNYSLLVCPKVTPIPATACASPTVVALGKPTPVSGVITVPYATAFAGLTPNTEYIGYITANGPGGASPVAPGDVPFGRAGAARPATAVTIKQ